MTEELIRISNMDGDQSGRSEMTLELMEALARSDSRQLQSVLFHLSSSPDLGPVSKAEACGFLLPVLARIDPVTALDLRLSLQPVFQGHEDILPLQKLLETVAEKDPAVAAAWRERHLPGSD